MSLLLFRVVYRVMGLFSTAEEVAQIYQMLLNNGELNGKRYLSKETCKVFTTTVAKTAVVAWIR